MTRSRLLLAALLVAAVVPYFVNLGASSIWDANEAFYVETPREMIESGDYISPTFNYEPRLNKPVLSYWIVAGFYRMFGVSVAVQRVPIALGALVIVLTAFVLAWVAAPPSASRVDAGLWAALGLAVAPRLVMFARRIFIDIYISMFMGLALLFFALAERYPERRRLFLVLMYASVGLGVLTKGPVAALLPGLVFGVYLLLHGELRRVKDMMIPTGVLVAAAIVVPWYAALYGRYGWTYITSFVMGENVARFTDGVGVESSRPFYFYLPVMFSDSFPWSLLLVGAAVLWFIDWPAPRDLAFRVRTLLWLWVLVIVGFFSLSEAKQDLYIFPIVPAVAALGGVLAARGFGGDRRAASHVRWTAAAIGLLVAAAGGAGFYLSKALEEIYALEGATLISTAGIMGGLVTLAIALGGRARAALVAVVVTALVLNWIFVVEGLPAFERYKPVPPLSVAIRERATPDDLVVHYNVAMPSMVYYLRRHVDVLFDAAPFIERLRGERTVYAVLSDRDYRRLEPELGVPTCILARQPDLNVKLREVLRRDPLPEVLLITNRCR